VRKVRITPTVRRTVAGASDSPSVGRPGWSS